MCAVDLERVCRAAICGTVTGVTQSKGTNPFPHERTLCLRSFGFSPSSSHLRAPSSADPARQRNSAASFTDLPAARYADLEPGGGPKVSLVQEGPARATGAHDQADRDAAHAGDLFGWQAPWPRGKGRDVRVSPVSLPICFHFRRFLIGFNAPVSAKCKPAKSNRDQDGAGYHQPVRKLHRSQA